MQKVLKDDVHYETEDVWDSYVVVGNFTFFRIVVMVYLAIGDSIAAVVAISYVATNVTALFTKVREMPSLPWVCAVDPVRYFAKNVKTIKVG